MYCLSVCSRDVICLNISRWIAQRYGLKSKQDDNLVGVLRAAWTLHHGKRSLSVTDSLDSKALGAIPFAKSTMTQLGMSRLGLMLESLLSLTLQQMLLPRIGGGSPAHGDTLNPWDTRRTAGGSSCGEAALRLG